MQTLLQLAGPCVHVIARAGGGGSGGGGAGGGGGGGMGVIAAIGYFPAHFVTRWCRRHTSRWVAVIVGSIVVLLVSVPMFWLGILFGSLVFIGGVVGVHSGLNDWLGKFRRQFATGKKRLDFAASKDPAWREDAVRQRVSDVFYSYQHDWSTCNVQHMQSYLEPHYYQHAQLMMTALQQMGRVNVVDSPRILSANPVNVIDAAIDDQDALSMAIQATANDQLIDIATSKTLYTDNSTFEEVWWFDRNGNTWDLMRIDQATANGRLYDVALGQFATSNSMFYSLDWGWLLLPQRGQLFGKASFKNSDVNNHVIGEWNGHIVQLYTFIPARGNAENYLVGQIALPKSYGGIIIKRNGGWLGNLFAPHAGQRPRRTLRCRAGCPPGRLQRAVYVDHICGIIFE